MRFFENLFFDGYLVVIQIKPDDITPMGHEGCNVPVTKVKYPFNDLLEAIVGDLPEQNIDDYEITEREDGSYLVDAQIPFYDFLRRFDKTEWMNEGEQEFDTLAGFILHQLERIPATGDKMDWEGFQIEIIDMDAQRIDKVLVHISNEIKENMEEA